MKNGIFIIFLLKIALINLISKINLRDLKNHISEVHLVIQGNGTQNLLSDDYDILPSEVIVNGIPMQNCFENCKFCNGPGNITNNNCIECKSGFKFLNKPLEEKNCYKICENYYYFDESNNYHCTDDLSCPKKFSKLILNKNKCIDDCKKDDIYIYEFQNICFDKKIIETIFKETESNEITYDKENENNKINNGKEYLDEQLKNIQDLFKSGFNTTDISNGNDYVNSNEEITFTITTTENQ